MSDDGDDNNTDVCQEAGHTALHHYPEIFAKALAATFGPVLSFGCSTGEEVRSLKSLSSRVIHGVEINEDRLATCRALDPDGVYCRSLDDAQIPKNHYGLILAMSVLCRYPGAPELFPFASFERWVAKLDRHIRPGGLLVLWNANYDFRDTETFRLKRYDVEDGASFVLRDGGKGFDSECPDGQPGSGFLPKFSPKGTPLGPAASRQVPLAFRKG